MAGSNHSSRSTNAGPMQTSWRDLLSMLPLAGGSALALLSGLTSAQEPASGTQPSGTQAPVDQSSFDFWTQNIRNADSGGPGTRAVGNGPRASFVYYDDHNGFVTGSDIGDVGLADDGDLDILVNVDHVRPSVADQSRFLNLAGALLRIDVQQSVPLPRLAERLAWTAIAGFLPENKQLPALKEMTFNPGDTWGKLQTIPLPQAGGRWTWNFFLQKRKSRWMHCFRCRQLLESMPPCNATKKPLAGPQDVLETANPNGIGLYKCW